MRSVILRDRTLAGWEFGTVRCLEEEIIKQTSAAVVDVFQSEQPRLWRRFGHGTRYAFVRPWLRRRKLDLPQSDLLWLVLMGPENYYLDLFDGWAGSARLKVVYLCDTLPGQYHLLQKLFSGSTWDICITSFGDSVPALEKIAGRTWYHVDQGVNLELFRPSRLSERIIDFSSYGRRHPEVHDALVEFCESRGLYYDFTTHDCQHPMADSISLVRQYAWHLSHSKFTLSWPVEMTNPRRAGGLRPITCRWFEAAAAGTPILGSAPANEHFETLFGRDLVVPISTGASRTSLTGQLESIWKRREELGQAALDRARTLGSSLGWPSRVARMLELVQTAAHQSALPRQRTVGS